MAILQFLQTPRSEEHIFRVLKALYRFCVISHSEVPMYIQMLGPAPTTFSGTSERVDLLVDQIQMKVNNSRAAM